MRKNSKKAILLSGLGLYVALLISPKICKLIKENDGNLEEEISQSDIYISPSPTVNKDDVFYDINMYAYVKDNSVIYDNYKDVENTSNIEIYQKVFILSSNGKYYNIKLDSGETGYILIDNLEILPTDFIETDLSDHLVRYYDDNNLVYTFLVDVGKSDTPTDMGYFEVYQIDDKRNLCGSNYVQPVSGFIVYNGGEGFHDLLNSTPYYTSGSDLSHGCTRMNTEDFYKLKDCAEIKTKVLVHK